MDQVIISFYYLTKLERGVVKPFLQEELLQRDLKITANKASPLGPELKDIELEKVYLEFSRGNNILLKLNSNFAKYLASDNSAIFMTK